MDSNRGVLRALPLLQAQFRRAGRVTFAVLISITLSARAWAAEEAPRVKQLDVWALLEAGGTIGWIIMAISVWMVALLVQQLISLRRTTLMPVGLAEEVHTRIAAGQFPEANQACQNQPSYLGYILSAGLTEAGMGYSAVEKAMEDASQQQAARMFRGLEYFTVIGTIAPMLGLLGTVWGMILAFMEFEQKTNPQVSELAPGIYKALVTTLQGLCVAIPALAIYSILRNRVDELVAQTTLMAEHVFAGYKRSLANPKRNAAKTARSRDAGLSPDDRESHGAPAGGAE